MSDTIWDAVDALQALDFGYLGTVDDDELEAALLFLETVLDELEELNVWFVEGDLAIQYFLTDPERSHQYLYGPTDVQDGRGLIEKLKELAIALDEEEKHR